MSDIEPCAPTPVVNWSELGVSDLPTGTVTLLLADVEGSTLLWETQPEAMAAAVAGLDSALSEVIAEHDGVRPVEQGEGDSFVVAFARASDAVACALDLQRAAPAPIRLRIGVHTGEIRLRDDVNYVGPTINRAARLRDLGHGGQTLLSGATEPLVVDRLPQGAWLTELGTHPLRDMPRPERVVQLHHADIVSEFPPLRVSGSVVSQNLPVQLTSFVGRDAELAQVSRLLADNRLVTLTGAGGVGKTRLAIELAASIAGEFASGLRYVDLAPLTDPELIPVTAARALGLPDQPGRSIMDTLLRFIRDRQMLIVLDNCEHLLDASAQLVLTLLRGAEGLTVLATSREAIGVAGEASWRVPSLSLADEATGLFTDRARHARPDFTLGADDAATVAEICARLDGVPLAIELAAARVRALSLTEILDSLHDRFRLLTGGARTAVRRQQTLRASVDWSHALLTDPERVVFRRLAVFPGGFDVDAVQAVAGDGDVLQRYQVLDLVTLLVDKSLVITDYTRFLTRYRLLETVRQYALEKLGESGEADIVRTRHRAHYAAMAASLDVPAGRDFEQHVERADLEIDNLRAAFGWSRENSDVDLALTLASSLQPLWHARGRLREGLGWFDTVLEDDSAQCLEGAGAVRSRALADRALLATWADGADSLSQAQQALAIARDLDDPDLLARALSACGYIAAYTSSEAAQAYFDEALGPVRASGDQWRLSQILASQAAGAILAGYPIAAQAAAEEGRDLADAIGERFTSRRCRMALGLAQAARGDLLAASAQFSEVAAEAEAAHDQVCRADSLAFQGVTLAYQGDTGAARAAAEAAVEAATELGGLKAGAAYLALAAVALAEGDAELARQVTEAAPYRGALPQVAARRAIGVEVELAGGKLLSARKWADDVIASATGVWLAWALATRARLTIVQGEPDRAEHDAHDALAIAAEVEGYQCVPDVLEHLGNLAIEGGSHRRAARLFGAAHGSRQRMGAVRFKVWDANYRALETVVREALGENDFDVAWAEGAALSIEDSIAYAQRGRGPRKRPASGWASLTPAECDVVRLVCNGLGNKEVATRLFVSPRTVQTHLTHVYTKLGLTSRVQLVQEAGRHL